MGALELAGRLGDLGGGILDVLGLVENDEVEVDLLELGDVLLALSLFSYGLLILLFQLIGEMLDLVVILFLLFSEIFKSTNFKYSICYCVFEFIEGTSLLHFLFEVVHHLSDLLSLSLYESQVTGGIRVVM